MKLIEIKCPNCDAVLNISDYKKKVVCEFCKTNFIIDNGVTIVRHLSANQITEEQEFINAEIHLNKFKNYEDSYRIYKSLSKRYVDNKETWIGLLRSLTHDFTYKINEPEFVELYIAYWNNYKALATPNEIAEYELMYNKYLSKKLDREIINKGDPLTEKCYVAVTIFGGFIGIHKFAQHKTKLGFLYLFTLGIFGIGYLYDVYLECTKWEASKQLKYSRYVLCLLFIIFGINESKYSWNLLLLYFLSGFFCLNLIWKFINMDYVLLRMGAIVITLMIAIANGSRSIPNHLKGKWIIIDSQNPITEIQIKSSGIVIVEDGKELDYSSAYYKDVIYVNDSDSKVIYRMKYKENIKKICLLEDDQCISYYRNIKEDE